MDKDEIYYIIIDFLKGLISIPRLSRQEEEASDYAEQFLLKNLKDNAKLTRVDNNLLATPRTRDPSLPTILLNSHIDTVKPVSSWTLDPFEPYIDDSGKLYGIGSNDAGGSLASLLGVFFYFLHHPDKTRYNLLFLISAEEEISGKNGIEKMIPFLNDINFAIVGEPTGMNPAVAEKGLLVIDGVVKGVSGHAARNQGINAIYKALPIIDYLKNVDFPKSSPWLGKVKISVTQINAGTQHNVIPDKCSFVVDVRTTDLYDNTTVYDTICASMPSECTLSARSFRLNPSSIPMDNVFVKRLIMMGREPFGSPTLSDQALMPWPSVKVGPGKSERSHTADEFIYLDEIREAIEIYIKALE